MCFEIHLHVYIFYIHNETFDRFERESFTQCICIHQKQNIMFHICLYFTAFSQDPRSTDWPLPNPFLLTPIMCSINRAWVWIYTDCWCNCEWVHPITLWPVLGICPHCIYALRLFTLYSITALNWRMFTFWCFLTMWSKLILYWIIQYMIRHATVR